MLVEVLVVLGVFVFIGLVFDVVVVVVSGALVVVGFVVVLVVVLIFVVLVFFGLEASVIGTTSITT